MFLKKISINNYKSIRKADISFDEGLNIIIGKNGAGKSNLLNFIYQYVNTRVLRNSSRYSKNNIEYDFEISYTEDEDVYIIFYAIQRERVISNDTIDTSVSIKISKSKNKSYLYENYNFILNSQDKRKFIISPDKIKAELDVLNKFSNSFDHVSFEIPKNIEFLDTSFKYRISSENEIESEFFYSEFNVLNSLDFIITSNFSDISTLHERSDSAPFSESYTKRVTELFNNSLEELISKFDLIYTLQKHSPVQGLRLNPNINLYVVENTMLVENLSIDFKVNGSWVPWSYLSDGTKRLFYIITECLSLESGMLLIEEPELGIHPHQLFSLMSFLKEQSRYKQIIISTHSPMVLDVLEPDELNRINIARITENGTQFSKLSEAKIAKAKAYITETDNLSRYWINSDLEDE